MGTFVLVHGGWHGSWVWKRVRPLLRQQGHEVFTPTLTGVGERSHLLSPDVHLQTNIDDVVNLIKWEELDDIVLCGHSSSGMVITGVAEAVPERIRTLIYLDASVAETGQSFFGMFAPAFVEVSRKEIASEGDGWRVPPWSAEQGLVAEADVAWVNRQLTPQSLATFDDPISYTDRATSIADIRFIMTTDWPKGDDGQLETPWTGSIERARQRGWPVSSIATHHDAMLDDPDGLADLLTGEKSRLR